MGSVEKPLYESRRTFRSMGQRYLVYSNRIELRTVFGRYQFRWPEIESLKSSKPGAQNWSKEDWKNALKEIKLDWADFFPHLVLQRRDGWPRLFHFTPDNLDEFIQAVDLARLGRSLQRG